MLAAPAYGRFEEQAAERETTSAMSMPIVLVTGAAPYLGGPQTWLPLRRTMPGTAFEEVDGLTFAGDADPVAAFRSATARALDGASAVVAHWSAARIAIEAAARVNEALPVVLLSPLLVTRPRLRVRMLHAIVATSPGAALLRNAARSKHAKLRTDPAYVRTHLRTFVCEAALSDALLEEAVARVRDARTQHLVERTVKLFIETIQPIDSREYEAVKNRTVLLGDAAIDRRTALRDPSARVIPGVHAAAMLDTPQAVAEALTRALE